MKPGPKPQGERALTHAERQARYRARHLQPRASIPDYDPTKDGVYERATVDGLRDRLHASMLELERRQQDVAQLEKRCAQLEGELKLEEQRHANTIKEVITIRQKLEQR
jgi:hypothetical protein